VDLTTNTLIQHNQFYQCFINLLYFSVDLEKEINNILFNLGKEIKIHRVDKDNTLIEIEYEKYTIEILRVFMNYLSEE
jgi:hypothetical protein